jgi:hypothetical protein
VEVVVMGNYMIYSKKQLNRDVPLWYTHTYCMYLCT